MRTFVLACAVATVGTTASAQELRRSGFIGVQVVEADGGVRVQALVDGGSAKVAGLEANDIISGVGDHQILDVSQFVSLVRELRAGDVRTLRVRRGGATLDVSVPIRPRPYEQAPDVSVTYGAVSVDGSLRRTIITAPPGDARHPAVLYVNGIGCFSQESIDRTSNDARLLYALTRAGFVTMRVEKSGMGDSEGPPCAGPDADFHAEIRAYTAGLRALKSSPSVDPDALFVMGLSIGGVEAPLIAAEEPVRGLIAINTVAKPLFEYLIDTRRRQLMLAGTPPDEIDRRMAMEVRCNHRLLVDKQKPEAIVAAMSECGPYIEYPAPFTFMQQWADVNVAAAWKAIDRPVLIVYGESDFVSTIADNGYFVEMINAFHPDRATLKPIGGMDHGLNRAASMSESFGRKGPGEFNAAIVDVVIGWLRERA
jgi:pimeloyl-ACP methyl ester carboxylesterase